MHIARPLTFYIGRTCYKVGKLAPANIAAASVNRRKKEDVIAQQNLALYKRLQAIKPSGDVSRNTLAKSFQTAQGYGANARKFRPSVLPEAIGTRRQQQVGESPPRQQQGYQQQDDEYDEEPSPGAMSAPVPAAAPPAKLDEDAREEEQADEYTADAEAAEA
jgi:hypothetical protein